MVHDYERLYRDERKKLIESIIASGIASRIGAHEITRLIDLHYFESDLERYNFTSDLNLLYSSLNTLPKNTKESRELKERLSPDGFSRTFPKKEEVKKMQAKIHAYEIRTLTALTGGLQVGVIDFRQAIRMLSQRGRPPSPARHAARRMQPLRISAIPLYPPLKRRAVA